MIGTRLVPAALLALVLVPLLGSGGPDPAVERAARALVLERAAAADAALAAVEAALSPGLDAARRGAALVVSGEEEPAAQLETAAGEIASAEDAVEEARRAVDALEGARRALGEAEAIRLEVAPGEVGSVAAQLDSAGPAANAFTRMRALAEGLVARLETALAALEDGALEDGRSALAAVRSDHDTLAAWEVELVTLPVWLDTTDAMIGAVEAILVATESGDTDAARAAAEDFAAAAEDAGPADRALRIAIGEGGSAVTAAPLGRLAELLREVSSARLEVASIVQTVGR
ncbi:MAG TPA: hypothetical protein VFP30_08240 [Candidatus Limnocylindria bacterium]|nr:hypothetical protein [Candidatus Limnocylindria bacterium]